MICARLGSGLGYARIDEFGRYHLTPKLTSHALHYLELIPLVAFAGPLLEDLAVASGELARLNLVDGNHLVRVSKAQGRQSGLKYDPLHVHGGNIPLASTASGLLLLSSLSDDEAAVRLRAEGFALPDEYGSAAPRSIEGALNILHKARTAGCLYLPNIYEEGIAALAYPIRAAGSSDIVGVLTVSDPASASPKKQPRACFPSWRKSLANSDVYRWQTCSDPTSRRRSLRRY